MGARILIADDEPKLLQAVAIRLTASGFTCEIASNGREALEKLATWVPDLVIADLLMPEVDGYALLRQLKSDPRTGALPVIILTAVPDDMLTRRAKELKGICILQKPFETVELVNTVRRLLASTTTPGDPAHD